MGDEKKNNGKNMRIWVGFRWTRQYLIVFERGKSPSLFVTNYPQKVSYPNGFNFSGNGGEHQIGVINVSLRAVAAEKDKLSSNLPPEEQVGALLTALRLSRWAIHRQLPHPELQYVRNYVQPFINQHIPFLIYLTQSDGQRIYQGSYQHSGLVFHNVEQGLCFRLDFAKNGGNHNQPAPVTLEKVTSPVRLLYLDAKTTSLQHLLDISHTWMHRHYYIVLSDCASFVGYMLDELGISRAKTCGLRTVRLTNEMGPQQLQAPQHAFTPNPAPEDYVHRDTWTCPTCTFDNNRLMPQCEMCTTPKP